MTIRIVEFSGENPELVDGLGLHPNDPPKMLRVMSPYMEVRKDWLRRMSMVGVDDGRNRAQPEAVRRRGQESIRTSVPSLKNTGSPGACASMGRRFSSGYPRGERLPEL